MSAKPGLKLSNLPLQGHFLLEEKIFYQKYLTPNESRRNCLSYEIKKHAKFQRFCIEKSIFLEEENTKILFEKKVLTGGPRREASNVGRYKRRARAFCFIIRTQSLKRETSKKILQNV